MSNNHPPPKPDTADTAALITRPELDAFVGENSGPGARRTLRCRTVATGHFRQMNHIRDLPPQAIEQRTGPAGSGVGSGYNGDAAAPTPCEALLSALGSCLAVGIQANAVARAVPIKSLSLEIEADFDPSAAWGVVNADPRQIGFNAIRITARIESDAPRAVLEALLSHVVLWSPTSNTLYNPVHIEAALA